MEASALAELLQFSAGSLLSLGMTYFPKVKEIWENLDGISRRRWMGLMIFITAGIMFAMSCFADLASFTEAIGLTMQCTKDGLAGLMLVVFRVLIGSQSTFLIAGASSKK